MTSCHFQRLVTQVSIQLVSPARGELGYQAWRLHHPLGGFHSIGFPCERGVVTQQGNTFNGAGFHSIGFPCERGASSSVDITTEDNLVSIQLVSPARGEKQSIQTL